MPLKKFRLQINIVCGRYRIHRDCYWPTRLNLGEFIYIEPDMSAKVIRVQYFMTDEPWWEIIAIPWITPFPEDAEKEEAIAASPESSIHRMKEMVEMTKDLPEFAKEKFWLGRWQGNW